MKRWLKRWVTERTIHEGQQIRQDMERVFRAALDGDPSAEEIVLLVIATDRTTSRETRSARRLLELRGVRLLPTDDELSRRLEEWRRRP
jgi:hypothetical protein